MARGSRALPAAVAGQTAVHLPHVVQASPSRRSFQRMSATAPVGFCDALGRYSRNVPEVRDGRSATVVKDSTMWRKKKTVAAAKKAMQRAACRIHDAR